MLTPLGNYLKTLRLQHNNMLLAQMAAGLSKPSSYISAIEYGRKPCPPELLNHIASYFQLNAQQITHLHKVAEESKNIQKIDASKNNNLMARTVAASFARQFSSLSPEQLDKLREILNEKGNPQ